MSVRLWGLFLLTLVSIVAEGQTLLQRCGSIERLQVKFLESPLLEKSFTLQRERFNETVRLQPGKKTEKIMEGAGLVHTIPVVIHIVMKDPSVITDAQVRAQLDTLNKNFMGSSGDSVRIPSYFKPLFGKSSIQFCLAQRTPEGEPTTGIIRKVTNENSFSNTNDGVKYNSLGGADIWNNEAYFNIWICSLDGILGYSSFPGESMPDEEGVVIDYRSLPGGEFEAYSDGKTLTHETGHYFNLYHTWGDDNGACTGTDYIDDTPNQASSTSGCVNGILKDNCTNTGNGIMYQNYMDYTNDDCLLLFTSRQVERMESALMEYHSSLLTSTACQPVSIQDYDAELRSVQQPAQRVCDDNVIPVIEIRNRGSQVLSSLDITVALDNVQVNSFAWTGSLAYNESATISLPVVNFSPGKHQLLVAAKNPNNLVDLEPSNDSTYAPFQYFVPVNAVSESFEQAHFPPDTWDIVNPDNGLGWKKSILAGKTGMASVVIETTANTPAGENDDLRLPDLVLQSLDSAFLSFQVAATASSVVNQGNPVDSFEVLLSRDCGQTYNIIYARYGLDILTRSGADDNFIPNPTEWRRDSVNLGPYIDQGTILIAFRKSAGSRNRLYLDDVNLRKVVVNPNLKKQQFLVTPNPARGVIAVQFYPQPSNLRAVQVFNVYGQKIKEIRARGNGSSYYSFDLSPFAAGVYVVQAVFDDQVLLKKIVKQ